MAETTGGNRRITNLRRLAAIPMEERKELEEAACAGCEQMVLCSSATPWTYNDPRNCTSDRMDIVIEAFEGIQE